MKRGMRTRVCATGLVCALVFWATGARAQDAQDQPSTTEEAAAAPAQGTTQATTSDAAPAEGDAQGPRVYMASQRVGGDLGWYSAKLFGSTFALIPSGSFEVKENIYVDVWAPVALNVGNASDKSYFGLGNPTVGAHYAMRSGPTTFYVGGRAGFPLIHLLDDPDMSTATSIASIAMTLYDNHLWVSYLPIGAFGGVEHAVNEIFRVRGELAPTILIPLGSRDAEFQYQLRGE